MNLKVNIFKPDWDSKEFLYATLVGLCIGALFFKIICLVDKWL
jgi:hypothetical protein